MAITTITSTGAAHALGQARVEDAEHPARARPVPVTAHPAARATRPAGPIGWAPFALLGVVLIPAISGTLRLIDLGGGPDLRPADPRFTASPLPLVVALGLVAAGSALWLTEFLPRQPGTGELAHLRRLAVGAGIRRGRPRRVALPLLDAGLGDRS